jgi:hypothetical protein
MPYRIPTPTDATEAARLRQIKPEPSPTRNQPSRTEVHEPPLEAKNQCIMRNTARPRTVVIARKTM